jgi:iron complex transport system permease protein
MSYKWPVLAVIACLSLIFGMFFGAAELTASELFNCVLQSCQSPITHTIVWELRIPRVIIGFLVGAGLAVAGATLQNITRNPLADPYLFGVISGAGLGASVALLIAPILPEQHGLAHISLPLAAFLGALFSVFLVQLLSHSSAGVRIERMLLAGVAISFMLSAISQFLLYAAQPIAATQVIFWLMGSVARAEAWYASLLFVVLLLCLSILLLFGRHFDALLLGDNNAKTLGVNIMALRTISLVTCAALTSVIVAYCGGIGFVGLMIPHVVRRWMAPTFRSLLFGCVFIGGIFMVWVDVFARTVLEGQEVPLGIVTSAIGSLFFIGIMARSRF